MEASLKAARQVPPGGKVGICALSGGFTSGAAILSIQHHLAAAPSPASAGLSTTGKMDAEDRDAVVVCQANPNSESWRCS